MDGKTVSDRLNHSTIHRLRALGVTPTGFYTEEVRRGGERVSALD